MPVTYPIADEISEVLYSVNRQAMAFAGSGSKNGKPTLLQWGAKDTKLESVSQFLAGYSIYSLSVAPSGNFMGAGTRAGLMRVFSLKGNRLAADPKPVLETFHQANTPVLSLAFTSDRCVVSAGMDGCIRFWHLQKKEKLPFISAHPGGVLAIQTMGSLVLASIGMDQVIKVWDLDTLELKWQSEPLALPKYHTLI